MAPVASAARPHDSGAPTEVPKIGLPYYVRHAPGGPGPAVAHGAAFDELFKSTDLRAKISEAVGVATRHTAEACAQVPTRPLLKVGGLLWFWAIWPKVPTPPRGG